MAENKENLYLSEIIKNIVQICFKLIKDYKRLVTVEMQLAAKSLLNIFILSLVVVAVLTTTWICLLGILIFYLKLWQWGWVPSLLIACGVNIFVLLGLAWVMLKMKANLSFQATRRQLQKIK
ncbi:hypothetical protein BH10PSE19_BH10PSE19_00520 [soil metagenome]